MRLNDLPTTGDMDAYVWECTWSGAHYGGTYTVGPCGEPLEDVSADRIAEVIHLYAVSPEGYGSIDFFAIVRLTDGQYGVSEAWADTSGFDCQGDAWWKVGPTYQSVISELSERNRELIANGEAEVAP